MSDSNQYPNIVKNDVSQIEMSAIKKMAMLSADIENALCLTWGLPSFKTPEHIRQAVKRQLDQDPDIGKYSLPDGLEELRLLASHRHQQQTGLAVDADSNILITAGNMQGMNILFHSLVDCGDEIIVTDPCFVSHIQQIRLCGGRPVFWSLDEDKDWQPDVSLLESLITPRTKAIVVVSPSNPTGTIFSKQDLIQIAELARAHGLLVILDDPYSAFLYENKSQYFNLASLSEYADHVAYLFSFSKCYAMSGWRLAYMVLPDWLKKQLLKVHDANIICAPRISQVAGIAALSETPTHLETFEHILAQRRELICQRLDRLPHVFDYVRPRGAYYVFPRIVTEHTNAYDFACELLKQIQVTVTPGSAFGPSGEHHVRMAFCVDDEIIEQAFDRMEKYFFK